MKSEQNMELPYLEMGAGFVLGLSVGYALKKSLKVLLLLAGLGFVFMIVLESQGAINIEQIPLEEFISNGVEGFKTLYELLYAKFEKYHISGGISALAGFALGIKIG